MLQRSVFVAVILGAILPSPVRADVVKHQVTGLFSPDREQDLREAVMQIPQVKLVDIDFKNAEATFEYDPAKAFPGAKPDQIVQRLDNALRSASHHTLGIKPLCTVPKEKLKVIEIRVAGLDCKACSLAAYEIACKVEGVERATVSFREGRLTAVIDPTRTDRAKIEAALKQREVMVLAP
jgi:copper chaperone CopZ